MSVPTRIVKPPVKIKPVKGQHGTNTTHKILILTCDDGWEYTIEQLSQETGLSMQMIAWRIGRYGWDHPEIMAEKITDGGYTGQLSGTAEWKRLSCRPRNDKLKNLPVGVWESRC